MLVRTSAPGELENAVVDGAEPERQQVQGVVNSDGLYAVARALRAGDAEAVRRALSPALFPAGAKATLARLSARGNAPDQVRHKATDSVGPPAARLAARPPGAVSRAAAVRRHRPALALCPRHPAGEVVGARRAQREGDVGQQRDADQRPEVGLLRGGFIGSGRNTSASTAPSTMRAPTCMSPPSGPLRSRSTRSEGQARSTSSALEPVPSRA